MGEFIAIVMFLLLALASNFAAYRNGVNDGYMAASEWMMPGYAKAVKILKKLGKWRTPEELCKYIQATLKCEAHDGG